MMCEISRRRLSLSWLSLCVLLCHVVQMGCERVLGEENDEFDFDGLPGAMHEFKVYVMGGAEECFFQPVVQGAKLHVNYEVLDNDRKVNFYVRDYDWKVVGQHQFQKNGQYTLDESPGGTYAVCIDNAHNRLSASLVYIYMLTFVMHEWIKFQTELMEVNILAANFSVSLTSVQESVADMRNSQAKARINVIKDWYLIKANNSYVFFWSLVQCIIIVAAAGVQVYSVRRLFNTSNVTPTTAKPRA